MNRTDNGNINVKEGKNANSELKIFKEGLAFEKKRTEELTKQIEQVVDQSFTKPQFENALKKIIKEEYESVSFNNAVLIQLKTANKEQTGEIFEKLKPKNWHAILLGVLSSIVFGLVIETGAFLKKTQGSPFGRLFSKKPSVDSIKTGTIDTTDANHAKPFNKTD